MCGVVHDREICGLIVRLSIPVASLSVLGSSDSTAEVISAKSRALWSLIFDKWTFLATDMLLVGRGSLLEFFVVGLHAYLDANWCFDSNLSLALRFSIGCHSITDTGERWVNVFEDCMLVERVISAQTKRNQD
eukprot:1471476-Amphidinium_carterae.1